jgi:hypothetical protein
MAFTRYALMLLILVVTADAAGHAQAPADFGLRLEVGCGLPDVLDTFKGTYQRGMSKGPKTAKIKVSDDLRNQLFDLVTEAQFFETPEYVTGFGLCEPAVSYRLYVKSAGRSRLVRWNDCGQPSTDEARRMQRLAADILTPFYAMRSVRRLPDPDVFCL